MNSSIEKILFNEEEITKRCIEIGKQIDQDYIDKCPLVVGLLKGSIPFMAELVKHITIDMTCDYMAVSSYQGMESSGDVRILKDLDHSIKGLDTIIVEDIIDTGATIKKVKEMLFQKGAKSIKVATLLDKKARRTVDIKGDYIGFDCPDEFVVGFGLDYNQKYRNLPFVGVLKPECYK